MPELNTFVDYVLYTKYWEYGLAFGFMAMFLLFYIFLRTPSSREVPAAATEAVPAADRIQGFMVPEGFYFHQGHTWAKPLSDDEALIGIDDFAQRLAGPLKGVELPEVGQSLHQGDKAWSLNAASKAIDMLSPMDGQVVEVNTELAKSPDELEADPYGKGWLIKVKAPDIKARLKNLFSGKLAKTWTQQSVDDLTAMAAHGELGASMADGGEPIHGIAKAIDDDNWDMICREFFMT